MMARELKGPHRAGSVGPCKATSDTPSAAARCIVPVLTATTATAPAMAATVWGKDALPART